MTSAAAALDIARQLYAAYDSHDAEAIGRLYHDDATHDEIAQLRTKRGAGEIAAGMQKLFAWLPDVRWQIGAIVAGQEGTIAVAYEMRATAPRKNGADVSLRGIQLITIDAGRIRHSEDYWDAATFQRQVS
ncbi:nuclear transport factor 2 family protein [Rhodopseudomonas sp. HC1]|uniref:nuclear transport factor 2 family protein n=1 Tax=Rhodopseudomonas infernalis TaxID=2897386 RepID=UPI001EE9361B|nr:nuclear transport factor 2 family protein [Rhodopseudomonas infernalis]MCG6204341.1 nuclear transport factor 2 family protein [Rhodopseudomonas infernalis]